MFDESSKSIIRQVETNIDTLVPIVSTLAIAFLNRNTKALGSIVGTVGIAAIAFLREQNKE